MSKHKAHPVKAGDKVFLVDGSSFVFRAYYQSMNQDRKYNSRADGLPSGAVRLFCTKLLQFVKDGALGIKPTHLGVILDKSEDSFRREIYPPYKANRPDPPAELVPQFPLMRDAIRAFGLIPIEQERYEADDLIATYAKQAQERGADVLIISADKDLMQLVGGNIAFFDFESGIKGKPGYRPERLLTYNSDLAHWGIAADKIGSVTERWEGLPPEKIVDVQALAGDSTDNVPGAAGIGLKTAAQLITEYGDLETLLKRASEIKQPKRRETLTNPESVEKIRLSKKLVALVDDVPLQTPLDDLALADPEPKTLIAFLKAMEFTTLTRRVGDIYGVKVEEIDPDPNFVGKKAWRARSGDYAPEAALAAQRGASPDQETMPDGAAAADSAPVQDNTPTPRQLAEREKIAARDPPIDPQSYETVTSLAQLEAWMAEARERGRVAFDTETTSLDPMQADLVGVSLATAPGRACYVPLQHRATDSGDLFGGGLLAGQIKLSEALACLKPILEDPAILKIGQNIKYDWLVMARHGIVIAPLDDTMLMSYVLDAGRNNHGMDELAKKHLGHEPIAYSTVAGSGKSAITFDRVPIDRATQYAAEDADITLRLWRVLKPRLTAEKMNTVYATLERGMVGVLARMERRGIAIDRTILSRLSSEFAQAAMRLEAEAQSLAGEPFNLASPKQLGDLLFGKMGLPGGKKTATGQWSTTAQVLEDLAAEGHPLPAKIVEWRQLTKLKSTYTDALPNFVNSQTKRVHTSYALASTTTGRLSSSDPNLQNIPIRTEEGRRIRRAFIAEKGHKLISADYSQIELRILAHIADIPQLRKAFADGIDIHAMTASEMFNVPVKGMPPDIRRRAKAINFGIIYGISAFGLANQLGISREEAGAYIRKYFERFPGIRDYMESTKAFVHKNGYVTTIFGRKCHYPQIDSKNPSERAFMERAAINAPIQGSAADIIRRAMLRMESALAADKLAAQMLLQVHDELVFEAPDEEVDKTTAIVTRVMERAPLPAVALSVPLQVEARAAQNWDEAH